MKNINLVHLFVVSVRASISKISISLDGRKIQKSCFLANVNFDGKHMRQIEKDKYSTALTDRPLLVHCGNSVVAGGRVKNGAKMKKTGSRKSKKKMAAVSEKEMEAVFSS